MKKIYFFFFITVRLSNYGQTWEAFGNSIKGDNNSDFVGRSFDVSERGDRIVVANQHFIRAKVREFQFEDSLWKQVGDTLKQMETWSDFGYGVSMSGSGDMIAVSEYRSNENGKESGNTRLYSLEGKQWRETAKIGGSNPGDHSGKYISLNKKGNILAIGQSNSAGCKEGYACGKINVYENKNSVWKQKGNTVDASISASQHEFGLDSSGNTLATINYSKDDYDRYMTIDVYKFKDQIWTKAIKSMVYKTNQSGNPTVALSGNGKYLIVGFPNWDSNDLVVSGQVTVYRLTANGAVQIGEKLCGEKKYDYFGSTVDMNASGDMIAIGTSREKDGYVKLFRLQDGKWLQVGESLRGCSAKLNGRGDIVLVGNIYDNERRGILQAYKLK